MRIHSVDVSLPIPDGCCIHRFCPNDVLEQKGRLAAKAFERFLSAGGQGKFVAAPMGHALMFKPALRREHVDQYLAGTAS
jgi:hypothetical protein